MNIKQEVVTHYYFYCTDMVGDERGNLLEWLTSKGAKIEKKGDSISQISTTPSTVSGFVGGDSHLMLSFTTPAADQLVMEFKLRFM